MQQQRRCDDRGAAHLPTRQETTRCTRFYAVQQKGHERRDEDHTDNSAKDIHKDKNRAAGSPSGNGGDYSKVVQKVADADNSEVGKAQHQKGAGGYPLEHGVPHSKKLNRTPKNGTKTCGNAVAQATARETDLFKVLLCLPASIIAARSLHGYFGRSRVKGSYRKLTPFTGVIEAGLEKQIAAG